MAVVSMVNWVLLLPAGTRTDGGTLTEGYSDERLTLYPPTAQADTGSRFPSTPAPAYGRRIQRQTDDIVGVMASSVAWSGLQ